MKNRTEGCMTKTWKWNSRKDERQRQEIKKKNRKSEDLDSINKGDHYQYWNMPIYYQHIEAILMAQGLSKMVVHITDSHQKS